MYKTLFIILFFLFNFSAISQTHPRLLYNAADLEMMRTNVSNNMEAFNTKDIIKNFADVYKDENRNPSENDLFGLENFVAMGFMCNYDPGSSNTADYVNKSKIYMNYIANLHWTTSSNHLKIANLVFGLSVGYDMLYEYLNSAERKKYAEEIIRLIRDIKLWQSNFHVHENNHLVHRLAALIAGAYAVKGDYTDKISDQEISEIIEFAKRTLIENPIPPRTYSAFEYLFEDGSFVDDGMHYTMACFGRLLMALIPLSNYENYNWFDNPKISQAMSELTDFWAYKILPNPIDKSDQNQDCYWNMMGDTYKSYRFYPLYFITMANIYNNSTAKWIYNKLLPAIDYSTLFKSGKNFSDSYLFYPTLAALLNFKNVSSDYPAYLAQDKEWPASGLNIYRSNFNQDGIVFSIQNKPALHPKVQSFIFQHNQPDRGNFTLSAYGEEFVVDAGYTMWWYYTYNGLEIPANNIVTIDRHGQARRRNDLQNGIYTKKTVSNSLNEFNLDLTDAYNQLYVSSPPYSYIVDQTPFDETLDGIQDNDGYLYPIVYAKRYLKIVKETNYSPFYVIIADELNKDNSSHTYRWNFRTHNFNSTQDLLASENKYIITGNNSPGHNKMLVYVSSYEPTNLVSSIIEEPIPTENIEYTEFDFNGNQVVKSNTPANKLISFEKTAINPYFHIILYPYRASDPAAIFSNAIFENGNIITANWPNVTDYSILKYENDLYNSVILTNAKISFIRKDNSTSKYFNFSIDECNYFTFNGISFIPNEQNALSATLLDGTLNLAGLVNRESSFYAPNISTLLINSQVVGFTQINDRIDIAPLTPINFNIVTYNNHPKLQWTANSESDISGYEIWKHDDDWVFLSSTSNNYFVDNTETKFLSGSGYGKKYVSYKVRAVDQIQNKSAYTASKNYAANDIQPPDLQQNNSNNSQDTFTKIENFNLYGNSPNPFNPNTHIKFDLPDNCMVSLKVYSIDGRLISELVHGFLPAGSHIRHFDGTDLPSGIYIYKLSAKSMGSVEKFEDSQRMLLLK